MSHAASSSRFADLVARRPVQAVLVLLAGVASMATSQPAWSVQETVGARNLVLAPGATDVRVVSVEGSATVDVKSVLVKLDPRPEHRFTLKLEPLDTAEDGCRSETVSFEGGTSGTWMVRRPTPNGPGDAYDSKIREASISLGCWSGTTRRARATVTNDGTAPLEVAWELIGFAGGNESNDPPDDAFVRIVEEAP